MGRRHNTGTVWTILLCIGSAMFSHSSPGILLLHPLFRHGRSAGENLNGEHAADMVEPLNMPGAINSCGRVRGFLGQQWHGMEGVPGIGLPCGHWSECAAKDT